LSSHSVSKKVLVLLTSRYPYKPGEEFLSNEIAILSNFFDHIHIIPTNHIVDLQTVRPIPNNVTVHLFDSLCKPVGMLRKFLRAGLLFLNHHNIKVLKEEWKRASQFGMRGILKACYWFSLAEVVRKELNVFLNGLNEDDIILYSYWLSPAAMAITMVDKTDVIKVARAHGGDLYEYRYNPPYLPFQISVIKSLDRLFTISKDGYTYLVNKDESIESKLSIARLGTRNHHQRAKKSKDGVLRIVTCSYLKPVKRISLLVQALSYCKSKVLWTHIGDGELRDEILEKASQLPPNIEFRFLGNLSNDQVLETYTNYAFDLFVNVSESEGIPVTIMEAFSFGIPVMATNVGGTAELVNDENGVLISKDVSPQELGKYIDEYALLPDDVKEKMSEAAYRTWSVQYNAEQNYSSFAKELLEIKEMKKDE